MTQVAARKAQKEDVLYTPLERKEGERRARHRFNFATSAGFRLFKSGKPEEFGEAEVVNMSSTGLMVKTEKPLGIGRVIELKIVWPVLLNGSVMLKLVVTGYVVWENEGLKGVRLDRYEFRTSSLPAGSTSTTVQ